MRRSLIAATAGAFFLLGTASAFSADAMTDGTYFTDDFGNNNCGLLTVSKGKPSSYQAGPCNGSKNGLASVSYSRNGLGYRGKTATSRSQGSESVRLQTPGFPGTGRLAISTEVSN